MILDNQNLLERKYGKKSHCKELLGNHINTVFDYVLKKIEDNSNPTKEIVKFSTTLYWIGIESFNEANEEKIEKYWSLNFEKIINYKTDLYKKIQQELGTWFNYDDKLLLKTLDFTIDNFINSKITNDLNIDNIWNDCNQIFQDDHFLYSFSDNIEEYGHYITNRNKKTNESEIVRDMNIGVIRKGASQKYSIGQLRDTFALRKVLLDILNDEKHDSTKPITISNIYNKFISLGIKDISSNNIYNWILKPLKQSIKIGSNRHGYFIINNDTDLMESYNSHLRKYRGYYNTLEEHRKHSINPENFKKHHNTDDLPF